MKPFRIFFLVVSVVLNVTVALAWGQTGHRAVGLIAENHLTKKARKNIASLLGDESLAMASTWMDDIRSDAKYNYVRDWHWVTIPDEKTYAGAVKNPDGDVVKAIGQMKAVLKCDTASKQRRVEALKMLIHLVGDLHQPLHVGTGEDKGGNAVNVKWFYKSSNLHRVWDSGMIDQKQLSYTELAESIDQPDKTKVEDWNTGNEVDWAEEAIQYRDRVYNTGSSENLGYRYMYANWSLVEQQLLKAGIRLAGILNEIYG